MPAPENTITTEDIDNSLDIQMALNFDHEYDRLAEILGIFAPEVVAAGTAMYVYEVTGNLNSEQGGAGEEVKLSKYTAKKVPIGEHSISKYRKATTAEAILKSGYENSVMRTDRRMLQNIRAGVIDSFFSFMAKGTGTATGDDLQGALAFGDAALSDALESNGDEGAEFVHFVNRQDVAGYLAKKDVTTQTVFGMDYLQDFLGVKHLFITNKVPAGKAYVTMADNIHVYGVDFSALDDAGLSYETQGNALIGVHHEGAYGRASAETHVVVGCDLLAEVLDYIVIASFGTASASAASLDDAPAGLEAMTNDQLKEHAAERGIDLGGATKKADIIAAIQAAE